jgi:glutathione S-transferase
VGKKALGEDVLSAADVALYAFMEVYLSHPEEIYKVVLGNTAIPNLKSWAARIS